MGRRRGSHHGLNRPFSIAPNDHDLSSVVVPRDCKPGVCNNRSVIAHPRSFGDRNENILGFLQFLRATKEPETRIQTIERGRSRHPASRSEWHASVETLANSLHLRRRRQLIH